MNSTSPQDLNDKELYARALGLQMQVSETETIRYLDACTKWHHAKTVVDLGCGLGDFFDAVIPRFEDKEYLGIDVDRSFLETAKLRLAHLNCEFTHGDVNHWQSINRKSDFVHVRGLLQHLDNVKSILDCLEDLTKEDGSVLFMDSPGADHEPSFFPDIPTYRDFLKMVGTDQKAKGGNRDCLDELINSLDRSRFSLEDDKVFYIGCDTDKSADTMSEFMVTACALLSRLYGTPYNEQNLSEEVQAWKTHPDKSAKLPGRWVLLARKEST